jgi:hypothetical protein
MYSNSSLKESPVSTNTKHGKMPVTEKNQTCNTYCAITVQIKTKKDSNNKKCTGCPMERCFHSFPFFSYYRVYFSLLLNLPGYKSHLTLLPTHFQHSLFWILVDIVGAYISKDFLSNAEEKSTNFMFLP